MSHRVSSSWNTYYYTIGSDPWTGEAVQVGADGAVSKGKISQENRSANEFVWRLFDTADAAGKPGSASELRFRKVQPGPADEHLKFLEPMVGNWKVVTTEGDKTVSVGEESCAWILNKNFLRHVGWGRVDGKTAHYELYTGWNPKTKEVFQWAVGAIEAGYAVIERRGTYDSAQRVLTARESSFVSNDEKHTLLVDLKFVDADTIAMDFRERRMGNDALPDRHAVFSRQAAFNPPATSDTPGPGHEHLKVFDLLLGTWKLEATLPDGNRHAGEELYEWAFNKNFLRTKGWGKAGDQDRFEYELLMGWDPLKEKIFLRAIASTGWHGVREGTYDPEKKCFVSRQTSIEPDGVESLATIEEQFLDKDRFVLKFKDGVKGGQPQPAFEVRSTRISP